MVYTLPAQIGLQMCASHQQNAKSLLSATDAKANTKI